MSTIATYAILLVAAIIGIPILLRLIDGCVRVIGALFLAGLAIFFFAMLLQAVAII